MPHYNNIYTTIIHSYSHIGITVTFTLGIEKIKNPLETDAFQT